VLFAESSAMVRFQPVGLRSLNVDWAHSPQTDLAHVLLRWQEPGLVVWNHDVLTIDKPSTLRVQRPGNFRHLWYRASAFASNPTRPRGPSVADQVYGSNSRTR
jgi:hypothetical protein